MLKKLKHLKALKDDLACVFDRDPAARSWLEVATAYPGVHAVLLHRVSHSLWEREQYWSARMLSHAGRWATGIEIHPGAKIGRRFFIDHGMGVVIGETAEIGDDCTLYQAVTLGGTSWDKGKRHPTLGNNVVVGAGAKVLGPIRIGDGARVGSNAVVIKPVPNGNTAVGFPAYLVQDVTEGDEGASNRQAIAEKMGFDAYGLMRRMPDPVSRTINGMLDHIHKMDERLEALSQRVGDCDDFENLDITDLELRDCLEAKAAARVKREAATQDAGNELAKSAAKPESTSALDSSVQASKADTSPARTSLAHSSKAHTSMAPTRKSATVTSLQSASASRAKRAAPRNGKATRR